ncbi:hypothetical protein B5M09_004711 [Aphanomyces astaci]|uniref:Uncharacterized protein n=1 Tax=Aphanomyces astaci TaxID=112090 RepID=A0A3R7WI76_APHAT|nr:hypothetical protein B5M09_004711 [Aphanomyces astaci]
MLEHKSSLTSCDLSGNSIGSHVSSLSRNRIDDDGAAMLASALQQLKFTPTPTRKWRINLLGNAITDAGVAHLASAMKKCTVVTSIDVANSKAYGIEQPERVVFIEHCARRNTRQVAHQVAEEVVRAMAQSERKAEITRLEHVQLTEVDCVSLGHALRRSHATTHLVLRNNTLTLAGLRLFAPSLSVSMSLFSITLVDNNVGGDGLFALLMAIRDNSTEWPLRELHIINSTATYQHVRWCRMQYVARQVARDAIAWHLRPVTVLYVAEQLCMQRQDMNATVVLDTHAMTVNDWNVSLVWDLMVEVLCMHRCDLNVHIVYECLSMAGEDSRR